jgi:hypothetical protein
MVKQTKSGSSLVELNPVDGGNGTKQRPNIKFIRPMKNATCEYSQVAF